MLKTESGVPRDRLSVSCPRRWPLEISGKNGCETSGFEVSFSFFSGREVHNQDPKSVADRSRCKRPCRNCCLSRVARLLRLKNRARTCHSKWNGLHVHALLTSSDGRFSFAASCSATDKLVSVTRQRFFTAIQPLENSNSSTTFSSFELFQPVENRKE